MTKIIKWNTYPKTMRLENAIVTEKIDGSNFSWILDKDTNELKFYSRNREVKLEEKQDKFYHQFIIFINERKDKLIPNWLYYAEVLGQAQIKYHLTEILDKLYLFDIDNKSFENENYNTLYWHDIEEEAKRLGVKTVPLTELNTQQSKLNSEVLREGVVLRFEGQKVYGINYLTTLKVKIVERKHRFGKEISLNEK